MTSQTEDVSTLISRVALRDRDAFRTLYSLTSAKLFGVALRILRNRAEAEDAVQEIYLRIWDNAASYRTTQYSPMSWLITVARNHCIDRIRASKPATVELDDTFEIADTSPDPERAAISASEWRLIDGCLDELDNADAIRGAYLDGYSYQELAERSSVPLNTMRTWLRRGLIKLKECLQR